MGIPVDNESVQQHFRLVHKLARKLFPMVRDNSVSYEDLFSEGCIGLIKALESYNPDSGNTFSTFAYPTISGHIRTYIDRRCQIIRFPAHIVLLARRIHKAGQELLSVADLVELHDCTTENAERALEFINAGFVSIDKPVEDSKGNDGMDLGFLASNLEDLSHLYVEEFLNVIPPKIRSTLRFLMNGYSREEIATELGLSRTRIWHFIENAKLLYQRYKMKGDGVMAGKVMTKEQYLELRMEGKSRKEVAKTLDQTVTYFENYWLKKWNIKDPLQEEIALELFQMTTPASDDASPPASGESGEQTAIVKNLRAELDGARTAHANCVEMAGVAAAKMQAEIDELRNDRDEWRRTATELKTKTTDQLLFVNLQEDHIQKLQSELDVVRESAILEAAPPPQLTGAVTLRIPLLDTGERDIEDRLQSLVTIGDLKGKINLREFNLPRLMAETLNRLQVIIGIIQAQTADIVEPADVPRTVQQFASRHNETHIRELRLLAEEHDWEVIEE